MKIDKAVFKIIVRPNSNTNEITGYDENKKAYRINIKAPADKNKANKEIIKFLSKHLSKRVRIKSGLTSKEKMIEVV